MTNKFSEIRNRMHTATLGLHGHDAVFTTASSATYSGQVWMQKELVGQVDGYETSAYVMMATIEYRLADFGNIEADVGETFTIDSIVYTVKSIIDNDGIVVRCEVN